MGRPRIHDESTRAALLEAAGRLLAEHGAGALNLRRLASDVGASTQAIYSLFGSKDGLVRAMHRTGFETLDEHLAAVTLSGDAISDLCDLALAYRASALAQPHLYEVMFACPIPEFEPNEEDQQLALGTLERLRTTVRRHTHAGAFASADPDELSIQLWALAHGLATLELQSALDDITDPAQTWRSAFRALLTGLTADT